MRVCFLLTLNEARFSLEPRLLRPGRLSAPGAPPTQIPRHRCAWFRDRSRRHTGNVKPVGTVAWKNKTTTTFDIARLKRERRELHDEYYTKVTISRPFEVRW